MIEVRDRLTEGVNRARLTLEARRAVRPGLVTLAGVAVGLLLAGYIAVHISRTFMTPTVELRFRVADVTGVLAGSNEVRYKGVVAGTVTKVSFLDGKPVLTAKIRKEFGPFYRDVRAALRPNTPLQDMYLNITARGSDRAGEASYDEPIPESQTKSGVHLDDVLGVFDAPERARLATLIDQLGNGMDDRGARLKALLVELKPLLDNAHLATQQLDQRSTMVKRLVRNVGVLTTELAASEKELVRLVKSGSQTVATLENGRSDLAATLRQLPQALTSATASFAAVRGVLGDVDGALKGLDPVVDKLPHALDDLERIARSGRPAVEALRRPVNELTPLVNRLRPVSHRLDEAVSALAPQVDTVDKVSLGLSKCIVPLQRFFQWNASFTKYGDVRAPSPRGEVVLGLTGGGTNTSPFESAPKACRGGTPITGRPARDEDGM